MTRLVALIPARAGSKRVTGKNTRLLLGEPLFAYAIAAAREAGIFETIAVSSDSEYTLRLAESYGARAILRPAEYAEDDSPDIQWVNHALDMLHYPRLGGDGEAIDAFAILRPTSPFRRGEWIRGAWDVLQASGADSVRAMRPVTEHPAKMWRYGGGVVHPLLPFEERVLTSADWLLRKECTENIVPWHSMPTQQLPAMLVQTAALEIAWTGNTVWRRRTAYQHMPSISGDRVAPYLRSEAGEQIDINTEADFERAERLAVEHPDWLPVVECAVVPV